MTKIMTMPDVLITENHF